MATAREEVIGKYIEVEEKRRGFSTWSLGKEDRSDSRLACCWCL